MLCIGLVCQRTLACACVGGAEGKEVGIRLINWPEGKKQKKIDGLKQCTKYSCVVISVRSTQYLIDPKRL